MLSLYCGCDFLRCALGVIERLLSGALLAFGDPIETLKLTCDAKKELLLRGILNLVHKTTARRHISGKATLFHRTFSIMLLRSRSYLRNPQ
jgi:hypothetical protein